MNPRAASPFFQTTRWSVVKRAACAESPEARTALAALCEASWYPIYAFIRRDGRSPEDAEDLTQGFFAWLLTKEIFARAEASRGKLRNLLLTCLRHYLAGEHDRRMAEKRGAARLISFDAAQAEKRYAVEPQDELSPDRLFQRRWALGILEASLAHLEEEFRAQKKEGMFGALRPFLGFGSDPEQRYEEAARALGIPLGTVKSHVFRLRERWRRLIFDQVAETLENASPEEIRGELAELLGCF